MSSRAVLPDPPSPRLSPFRVSIAILVLIAVATGGWFALSQAATTRAARADASSQKQAWFAPYVDATLTPTVAFQDRSANPSGSAVLGFVVAGKDAKQACTPTWGTYMSLAEAATSMDLDRRVSQLRGQGGDAVISFGGQANTELAVACDRPDDLKAAYRAVVDRYSADTIDFDIEGAALADVAANVRRAKAIKAVQDDVRADGGRLAVWLTVPVTTKGMKEDALAVVDAMLAAKVDLAGVNVMAMDFGEPSAGRDMLGAIKSALTASRSQVAASYGKAGISLDERKAWRRLGATVMIGQNDVDGERLSVADAKAVARFAAANGVGRVSMWSLNRDAQCGVTFPVLGTHSNVCSGAAQKKLEFTKLFSRLRGRARSKSETVTKPDELPVAATTVEPDDPARSPYPIWEPAQAYREDYKVVWHHAVYVAKWYSQGQTPDAENVAAAESPWRLIGPVLKTDRAPKLPLSPVGTHPAWSAAKAYRAGARVLYHRLPYKASWYTQGDTPGELGPNGTISAWKPLYRIPGEPAPR